MKKFLFTLATLLAFGASAQPTLSFDCGNEITLNGGESQEVIIMVDQLGGQMVTGLQWNFTMYDAEGNQLSEGCHLDLLEKYGTRDAWAWYGLLMEGANGTIYNNGTAATSSNGTYHQTDTWDAEGDYMPDNDYGVENVHVTYTGEYNVILANITANQVFTTRMSYPLKALAFTVTMEEGWEGEYATFKMVKCDYSLANGPAEGELIELKINNGSYTPVVGPVDLTGEIVIGDVTEEGMLPISYTGDEEVTIRVQVDGVYVPVVDGMVDLGSYGSHDIYVEVSGEGYNTLTASATVEWTEPEPPYQTPAPEVTYVVNEDNVVITATGEGEVKLFVNGEEVDNPYTIARTDEDQFLGVWATAQRDEDALVGISESQYILVPALEVEPPVVTPTPVITYTEGDEYYTITATGEGEVKLFVNGDLVDNPYDIARLEEDVTYTITATAQGEDMEISETATLILTVPALEVGPGPEDPHDTGYWLVAYSLDGEEEWYEFIYDKDNYTMILPLDYDTFGTFNLETEERPNINFNIVINGVMYGAADPETITYLGNALENPIYEGDNVYVLKNGLGCIYNMGLFIDPNDGQVYVYAAIAGYTDVNELNVNKTVASQRFFNMAGQEMQEANGMTIVVTTYTDGTTSAVKVIK